MKPTELGKVTTAEWNIRKKWNPFNSYKLLAQVYRWEKIKRGGRIPQPSLVTVDPINLCDHECVWCNSDYILKERHRKLSRRTLDELAEFFSRWQGNQYWEPGVEAVCVAGGGEPLLNRETPSFIDKLTYYHIQVGVVTNGSSIDKAMDDLAKCVWLGVSMDAGTSTTFDRLKGLNGGDRFKEIINKMADLIDYSKKHDTRLAFDQGGYGVSYKYLLHPENVGEIYEAAKIAKSIGCKNLHIRPAGNPWDKLNNQMISFSRDNIKLYDEQIKMARELEDETFGVYGVMHKFSDNFDKDNYFKKCHAIFMTAVIMPGNNEEDEDEFIMGLCCDRRGDKKLELARNMKTVDDIGALWGSKDHWDMFDSIDVEKECPRCTYQPHNQIYERVIVNDSMTFRFI